MQFSGGQPGQFQNVHAFGAGLAGSLLRITRQLFNRRYRHATGLQAMAKSIHRHQVAIATVIAGTTKRQNPPGLREALAQLTKGGAGRRLHQLEAIHALLIDQVAIHGPNGIGGIKPFW